MSMFHGKWNSDYHKASSLGKYVTVFVENEDDVPFWNRVLKKYAPQLKFRIFPSSKNNFERGKTHVLKLCDGLGDFMLLCVDSDYDYLLQNSTPDSHLINTNPYIFQTYTYSVENYKCFAESLGELCVQASLNDEPLFDFVEFLQQYSRAVYELFLFSFYLIKIGDTTALTNADFLALFGIQGKINISHNARSVLQKLQANVEKKLASLKKSHPNTALQTIAEELEPLGLNQENTYLFIKGHIIYQNLVLILLVVANLRSNKESEFVKYPANNRQLLSQKQKEYHKQTLDIKTLLAANKDYDSCFLLQYIQRDIKKYLHLSNSNRTSTALSAS